MAYNITILYNVTPVSDHFFQTGVEISKVIQIIEATEGVSFPQEERVLQAYLHFEALTNHDYTYSCVSCGYSPAVVVMDVHKNGVFDVPGELMGHSNLSLNSVT